MKVAQYYDHDRIRVGLITEEGLLPFSHNDDMIAHITNQGGMTTTGQSIPLDKVRLAPPVHNPSKIMAIGLNYQDHVRESKGDIPKQPLVFAKLPSSIVGHEGTITWDSTITSKVDFEAELAVVIGRRAYRCSEDRAMEAVFGYTCGNDVSARDLQFGDAQWVRGKSLDTFCPLGPWIVSVDEIPDPHNLHIRSILKGQVMQDSNTNQMIFSVPRLISYLSMHFTLMPGDVIMTGTPHGVGCFREPSIYMRNGDEIVVEIEGIGRLTNRCRTM